MQAARVLGGIFWSALNVVGTMGAGVLTSVLVARSLGSDDFGRYGYAMWLAQAVGQVATLGLGRPLARFVATVFREGDLGTTRALVGRGLAWTTIAGALLSGLLWASASRFGLASSAALLAPLAALALTGAVTGIATVALQATMRFRDIASANLLGSFGMLAGSGGLALAGGTWRHQIALAAVTTAASTAVLLRALWSTLRRAPGDEGPAGAAIPALGTGTPEGPAGAAIPAELRRDYNRYWAPAAGLMLIEMVVWQRCEVFFLNRYSTASELGHYNAAVAISSRFFALSVVISPVLNTLIARMKLSEERPQMHDLYARFTKYIALFTVPLFLLPAATSPVLLTTLFGHKFAMAAGPMSILLVGCLIPALGIAGGAVVYGTDQIGFALRFGFLAACATLGADALLIPRHGAVGAALGNLVGQMFAISSTYWLALRPAGFRFPVGLVAKVLGAGLFASGVARGMTAVLPAPASLVIALLSGATLYLAALFAIRPLDASDDDFLAAVRGRLPARLRPALDGLFHRLTRREGV